MRNPFAPIAPLLVFAALLGATFSGAVAISDPAPSLPTDDALLAARLPADVRALEARLPAGARLTDVAPMDQHIVGFTALPEDRAQFLGMPVVRASDGLRYLLVQVPEQELAGFRAAALALEEVRYVEWNNPFYGRLSFVPNDSRYNDAGHWGSKKIGAEAAWDRTTGDASVKVAVIDSGLKKDHEDFASRGNVLQGRDFANQDNDPADEGGGCNYHGTHVAGTASAHIDNGKGIAGLSQHTLLPVKALKSFLLILFCSGASADLADALEYAADEGAHIASNSWGGGGQSQVLDDAIAYAHSRDVLIVAAAGNDGQCNDCVGEPWASNPDKVIIVSCTTEQDTLCNFSSEGPEVDVAAPGDDILSTCGAQATSYCVKSGTSMSAPHVSGTLALMKAHLPHLSPAQLEARLKATAKDLGPAGFDVEFGHGRIDAAAALG